MDTSFIKPIFLKLFQVGNTLFPVYSIPIPIHLCVCNFPMCYCGCNFDILSYPKCICNPFFRFCKNCDKSLAFCKNSIMLRCFLGQDMCKMLRFTDSCSCNNLECRLNKPTLIIKKQVMINDITITNVYVVNIYFVDKKQMYIKTSNEIQSQIILDIEKLLCDAFLQYPAVFMKYIEIKDEMICNLTGLD